MRPFELRQAPPVIGEVKNGKKYNKNGTWLPKSLNHWRVVKREKRQENYVKIKEVHEVIGDKPIVVPIRFISDSPLENFSLFRAAFNKGTLMCGGKAPQSEEEQLKNYPAHPETGAPLYGVDIKEDESGKEYFVNEEGEAVRVERKNFNRATRHFRGRDSNGNANMDVEPYTYPCHKTCPIWQSGKCDLTGTLYFYLNSDELPDIYTTSLFVYRAKGTYAQKYLTASIKRLHQEYNGVMANLPFKLRFHQEPKEADDGNYYDVPMPCIETGVPKPEFEDLVQKEIQRRAKRYKMMHGRSHDSFADLKQKGMLEDMQGREVVETMYDSSTPPKAQKEESGTPDYPEELVEFFNTQTVPPRKRSMLWDQHEGDIEAIKQSVHQDKKNQPDVEFEDEDFLDDEEVFGDEDSS